MFHLKKIVSLGVCCCLCNAQMSASYAQAPPNTLSDLTSVQRQTQLPPLDQQCQTTNETEFRASLETLILHSLRSDMAKFNYRFAVADEWRKLEIGKTLDGEVDRVVENVRNEMSWSALLQSLSNSEKARELATLVAERVYNSEKMKVNIEELASQVGRSLAAHLEMITPQAANPAIDCLRQFLGPRYGTTVAGAISESARQEFQIGPQGAAADLTAGNLLKESAGGVTGLAILILRRQLANITERLGQRIVGSVLSRLVSVVAGSVGLVLIAKDLWDLRYGVLPIIAEEMKSEDSKNKVQDELAQSISEQTDLHLKDIGTKSAERIFTIWNEYRAAHTLVLDIAARNEEFRTFFDGVQPQLIPRLDEVAALILSTEGETGILNRLKNGTLQETLNHLPASALEIARQTRSLDEAIAWYEVAGDNIDKVVSFELFQRTTPSAFTKDSLRKVVGLENPLAVKRLAAVKPEIRDVLFEVDTATLSEFLRTHDEKDLLILASYITGLKPSLRQNFIAVVTKAPHRFELLKSSSLRDAVLASDDQNAALEMLMRDPALTSWGTLKTDFEFVFQGKVSPHLLWHIHPFVAGGALLFLFLILLLARRLMAPLRLNKAKKN